MEGSSSSSSTFVLLMSLLVFTSDITSCSGTRSLSAGSRSTKFITTSCSATTYPRLCVRSLSGYASAIQASPRLLANTALTVTLEHVRSTTMTMSSLSKIHGMKPREVDAMRDCVEEMADSVDEIQQSLDEMVHLRGSSNIGPQMNDIQTWLSAALTDEDTCLDGFAGNGLNGEVKTAVRKRILHLTHLTSNALALVNSYASMFVTPP